MSLRTLMQAGPAKAIELFAKLSETSVPVCEVMRQAAACDWDERGGGASGGSQPG
jgi:hypothetical protein